MHERLIILPLWLFEKFQTWKGEHPLPPGRKEYWDSEIEQFFEAVYVDKSL